MKKVLLLATLVAASSLTATPAQADNLTSTRM